MPEIEIVVPAGMLGASEYDGELDTALRKVAVAASEDPKGEWAEKCGTDFENDEFMMHRYCWCERDDCPWCGGCLSEFDHSGHDESCYQAELRREELAAGVHYSQPWDIRPGNGEYERRERIKRGIYKRLTAKYGLPRFGCAVHCTCGADDAYGQIIDACECDWHMGRAPFIYGPAQQAPNFWHKPSGFKVWWYKYIGRSVETDGTPPPGLLHLCLSSLESRP